MSEYRRTPMVDLCQDRFGNRRPRGICLQASTSTTTTNAPSSFDHYMPDFPGCTSQASIQLPILDNATTNTSANKDTYKVFIAFSGTIEIFTHSSNFNIIT